MATEKLISAEALLLSVRDDPDIDGKHFARIKEHIKNAPDAVKHGQWVYRSTTPDEDGNLEANCSMCGAGERHNIGMVGKVHFCWKCGADMRGAEDGKTE